jgi:cytochrome b561
MFARVIIHEFLSLTPGPPQNAQAARENCFKAVMHFSFYLMIAALVVVGLEVAYALYQLATFVL